MVGRNIIVEKSWVEVRRHVLGFLIGSSPLSNSDTLSMRTFLSMAGRRSAVSLRGLLRWVPSGLKSRNKSSIVALPIRQFSAHGSWATCANGKQTKTARTIRIKSRLGITRDYQLVRAQWPPFFSFFRVELHRTWHTVAAHRPVDTNKLILDNLLWFFFFSYRPKKMKLIFGRWICSYFFSRFKK